MRRPAPFARGARSMPRFGRRSPRPAAASRWSSSAETRNVWRRPSGARQVGRDATGVRDVRRHVAPQRLEVLLEQVGANRAQVATYQLGKAFGLRVGEILRTLEQEPAAVLEHRRPALGGELACLGRAHFVDRLGEVAHDVEAVEHLQRLLGALGDHLQVGLPHVRGSRIHGVASMASASGAPVRSQTCQPSSILSRMRSSQRWASGSFATLISNVMRTAVPCPGLAPGSPPNGKDLLVAFHEDAVRPGFHLTVLSYSDSLQHRSTARLRVNPIDQHVGSNPRHARGRKPGDASPIETR